MAINTITYANKSAIYTNASIPDANKVNDTDMNEIKTVVNDNATLMGDLATLNTTTKSSIVGAVNEVLGYLSWTFVDSKTGTASITLPNSFRELLFVVKINNADNLNFTMYVPYAVLSTTEQGFNSGYYATSTGNAYCRVNSTKTSAALNAAYFNGNNAASATVLSVYYR